MLSCVRAQLVQNETQVKGSLRLKLNLRADARNAVVHVRRAGRQLIFDKRSKVRPPPA